MQQELITKNWRDFIRPRRLEVEEETLTENYGRFACEPLERGFGTTLGNALRRVLLSSLQGSAITNIRINGVLHESLKTMGKRHECLRTLESEELTLQKAIDCYYSVDFQLDGNAYWLSDKQLNDLDNRAWHKIKRDPLEAAFRVIYECVREAIYRPASVTLKNLKDTDIRFRMEDVKFGHAEDQIQHLDITIKERGKRGKMAKVRLKKWHYNPTPECKRGGLFNAMNIYLDLNPQNRMGPIAYPDGSPITYTRFADKLRRWGSDAGIPFKVTPAALRRSTIRNFATEALSSQPE